MLPRGRYEALYRQIVDVVGLDMVDDGGERGLIEAADLNSIAEVLDATSGVSTGAARDPGDPIVQKERGRVANVLIRHPGDERRSRIHASVLSPMDIPR